MKHQIVPLDGDKNTGPEQEAVFGLFLAIAFILVSLRFYVRARMVNKLWWDDFFLLLGMVFSIIGFGLSIAKIHSGFGRHVYYLSFKQISFASKLEYIELPIVILSGMFTKISICLFLLRIFATRRLWQRAMYIIMALIVAANISSAFVTLPQCKPVAKLWNPTIKGTCWSQETRFGILYFQGGVYIFTDFLLALLPIYFLKDVQISFQRKLSICALMSLGVFTGICAITRTALTTDFHSRDITYNSGLLNIWAGLEVNAASIAAAIPALRPLWAKSANRNQKNRKQAYRPDDKRRLSSTYVMMDPQIDADSRLTCMTNCHGSEIPSHGGSKAPSVFECTGITKPGNVSTKNFRNIDGIWITGHSSLSEIERSASHMV